ncbi:hypothetical protein GGTG_05504 [Gaeumannomyces tritici R3-111a-1]|uniref:Uncharacterized protein n=1 Tax=Gaeumannomyces tritici (strain R3-111a-1) TaxID=644352 RepID=J3NW41_GAET3|nr:hypothetical protein GGTG_05504 [Gaeumannomyces tritici R3-111a-1]EJT75571.1 hypothetical protein GGTG_05504 [Gaeumannomyces tritici R3-111a-1]
MGGGCGLHGAKRDLGLLGFGGRLAGRSQQVSIARGPERPSCEVDGSCALVGRQAAQQQSWQLPCVRGRAVEIAAHPPNHAHDGMSYRGAWLVSAQRLAAVCDRVSVRLCVCAPPRFARVAFPYSLPIQGRVAFVRSSKMQG